MKKTWKRLAALLLAMTMLMAALPADVLAAGIDAAKAKTPKSFTDVNESDWFYDDVNEAVSRGLFIGVSEDRFEPEGTMTRAMAVTVLGRMEQVNPGQYLGTGGFTDVEAGSWYAPYVAWAAENAIVNGVGDRRFDPDGEITREQYATILVRYFNYKGITLEQDITTSPNDLSGVSSWAKEAVLTLWRSGLMRGDGDGGISPKRVTTRAEGSAFAIRVNDAVEAYYAAQVSPSPVPPDRKSYTITFNTNGGNAIESKSVLEGTALGNLPTPYRAGYIFTGWYYDADTTKAAAAADTVTQNLTLYAKYDEAASLREGAVPYFTAETDVDPEFTITIVSSDTSLTADDVKKLLLFTDLSSAAAEAKFDVTGNNGTFAFTSKENSFTPGGSYKLELLDDRLTFAGQEDTIREYDFTVKRDEEVRSLELDNGVKYIPADQVDNVTKNGQPVDSLSLALFTVGGGDADQSPTVTGTFEYSGTETIQKGDTVAVYEGLRPDEREVSKENDGKNGEVSYVIITGINGTTYSYKNAEVEDVVFKPDVLPVSNDADTDGDENNLSITVAKSALSYADPEFAQMGLDAATTIDVGDFLAFYSGDLNDTTKRDSAQITTYAQITSIKEENGNYIIGYESVTEDKLRSAMEVYDTDPIDGDTILKNVDVPALEEEIEQQAIESGFVEEAGNYLAAMALETDSFTRISEDYALTDYSITDENGQAVDMQSLAPSLKSANRSRDEIKIDKDVSARITSKLEHFKNLSGIRAVLNVKVTITIPTDEGSIVIVVEGSFEQEVRISLNTSGSAVWSTWWIFPYISEYNATISVDLYDYTGIFVTATITTPGDDGGEDISKQMQELMKSGGDESAAAAMQEQYQTLLENETEWADLISQTLFTQNFSVALIFTVKIQVDFVVSANVNISLGCSFEYENAKRYTYRIAIFAGNVTSDTTNLVNEHYQFLFYAMGSLGLRAGLRLSINVALICDAVANVGVTGEAGAYAKLWGYFYYSLEWAAGKGKSTSSAGAMLFEIGAYLEVSLNASAIGGKFSYNPTLLDKEWPLWQAGTQENILGFTDPEETSEINLKNAVRQITLPESVLLVDCMDMKTGKVQSQRFEAENYSISISNPAFTYDPASNLVKVDPGNSPQVDGEMTIIWKGKGVAFSSAPIVRRVALHWDNLRNGYYIFFNANGGSDVEMINKKYQEPLARPADPVRIGYVFEGWYRDEALTEAYTFPTTMPNEDVLLYAKWSPATDTPYTVEHYQQAINGSYPSEPSVVDKLAGTTGSTVTPERKADAGFLAPSAQQLVIRADGSSIVRYYYTRNSYTATFQYGNETIEKRFRFGEKITAPVVNVPGYDFGSWEGLSEDTTMPAGDVTFTAQLEPRNDTAYRVEHYQQNANDDGYTLVDSEDMVGTTDATAAVTLKSYDHFQEGTYEPTTVSADGKTVIKVQYDRQEYTITYDPNGVDAAFSDGVANTQQVRHGASVPVLTGDEVQRPGYGLGGWYLDADCTQSFDGVMPTNDLTVYAKWNAGEASYTVRYLQENADDDGYTLVDTQILTAKTGDTVTPPVNTYDNFTSPPEQTVTVAASGTVVEYKYTRNKFTLDWDLDGGTASESYTSGQVKHGASITAPVPTKAGYTFAGWDTPLANTMPAENTTYTAKWTPNTYTVTLDANGGAGTAEAIQVTYGTGATTLPTGPYTRIGYNFTGWKDSSGKTYTQVENLTANLTLYAQWEPVSYSITYELDGGTASGNPTSYTVENGAITLNAPTRENYRFKGWTWDGQSTPTTDSFKPNPGDPQPVTFTAHWLAVHTVTLEWDGNVPLRDFVNETGTLSMTVEDTVVINPAIEGVTKWKLSGGDQCTSTGTVLSLSGFGLENSEPTNVSLEPVWVEDGTIYSRSQLEKADWSKPVSLAADIDLSQRNWRAISTISSSFDGNNHTIYNLKSYGYAFCTELSGHIQNITFDGAETMDAVVTQAIIENGQLTNVNVINSTLTKSSGNSSSVGFLVGVIWLSDSQATINIKDCIVSDCSLNVSCYHAGGLIGLCRKISNECKGKLTITGCKVSNISLTGATIATGAYTGYLNLYELTEANHYSSDGNTNESSYPDIGGRQNF